MTRMTRPAHWRPETDAENLDLGPLTGDAEYQDARIDDLLRTWSTILGRETPLVRVVGEVPATDTRNRIYLPASEPGGDNILSAEHEIAHLAFGSDLGLAKAQIQHTLTLLTQMAGGSALPHTVRSRSGWAEDDSPLYGLLFKVYNIMEDVRIESLWWKLYPGSAAAMCARDGVMIQKRALHSAAQRMCPGVFPGTNGPPPHYFASITNLGHIEMCALDEARLPTPADAPPWAAPVRAAWRRVLQACEGTSAEAIAPMFTQFVVQDLHQLLKVHHSPPPPPYAPPTAGAGSTGKGTEPSSGTQPTNNPAQAPPPAQADSGGWNRGWGSPTPGPRTSPPPPRAATPPPAGLFDEKVAADAGGTPVRPHSNPDNRQRGDVAAIQYNAAGEGVSLSDSADQAESAEALPVSAQELSEIGRLKMLQRLEEIRAATTAAAAANAASKALDDEGASLIRLVADMPGQLHVRVGRVQHALPDPSPWARALRARVAQARLRTGRRRCEADGELVVREVVESLAEEREPRSPFVRRQRRHRGAEILLLCDISGSMVRTYPVLNQAVADIAAATKNVPNFHVQTWSFASSVWVFPKVCRADQPCTCAGGTALAAALYAAGEWALRKPRDRVVVVLTDGDPTECLPAPLSTGSSAGDLEAVVRKLQSSGARLVFVLTRPGEAPAGAAHIQLRDNPSKLRTMLTELVTELAAMR